MAIYNWAGAWAVGRIGDVFFSDGLTVGQQQLLWTGEWFGCAAAVLVLLFVPKAMVIWQGDPAGRLPQSRSAAGEMRPARGLADARGVSVPEPAASARSPVR
ncbi:G-protein coupled receptor activity protein [Polyrhizophydium stewartii]|uniref:G-protein coupled receptor activity protein n=1 Tax=Polyrhizophydium stewartii TaxID=2732419 RepID=A0ABR4MYN1_9FUNG